MAAGGINCNPELLQRKARHLLTDGLFTSTYLKWQAEGKLDQATSADEKY